MMKRIASLLAVFTVLLGGAAVVGTMQPAAAVGCELGVGASYASDYATVWDNNGYCGTIGVRHRYMQPCSTCSNKWGSWATTTGYATSDTPNAQLNAYQGKNNGVATRVFP